MNHAPLPLALGAFLLSLAVIPVTNIAAEINLALVAKTATSYVSGHETIHALNDGFLPENSNDKSHGAYGNWPRKGTQWVEYDWSQPISTARMEVYWFDDSQGVRLPTACRLLAWDGGKFVPVANAVGMGLERDRLNATTFPELTTARLRLEFDGKEEFSTGILDWRVYDSGKSPNFPPVVVAGPDRVVIVSGNTYLAGTTRDDGKPKAKPTLHWTTARGPGKATFVNASAAETAARFPKVGTYILKLTADDGQCTEYDFLKVTVDPEPPKQHLRMPWPAPYKVNSTFWHDRLKNTIVNWIPHCIAKIEDPKLPEGGLANFVEAAHKLAGQAGARHTGAPFANAWVYNTLESMCLTVMYDAQGDAEILKAQEAMKVAIERWIPVILAAQEPDGYLQTMYTIGGLPRWSNRPDHEDYNAGYFLEAAVAHSLMTGGKDPRMLDAAKRLADCWCANIGPAPKKAWFAGHQEFEQALVRLARYVEDKEGPGKGRKYVALAKFLLDSRQGGDEYDQSHVPVTRQYEAVGHAVRAVYSYSGMADVAMETGDIDYHSAVKSLWNSIVNRKYYVTGGLGSGETSEGFGKDYSLPNRAYCESCAGSGELFFQNKLQLTHQEGRYADLYEETLYNAILGGLDLEGQNFTYTNPLDSSEHRYKWHVCPCCVGNLPRTLLMLPSWMYSTAPDAIYVNLFAGSTVDLEKVAGTRVQLVQTTEYPWKGDVAITVNPAEAKRFALKVRVPNRQVSELYTNTPTSGGLTALTVNGKPVKAAPEQGYVTITRKWQAGDKVAFQLPLAVQRVKASDRITPNAGRVALRYGPLIYNLESKDQNLDAVLPPNAPLTTEWQCDLLGGVLVIKGAFADGSPMLAIPNYSRLNRGGRSIVWIKDR